MNQGTKEATSQAATAETQSPSPTFPEQSSQSCSLEKRWLERIDAGWLIVLSLPWAILRFDRTWLFAYSASPNGFIDPWVYFGFFLDLTQHLRMLKGAYFSARLSWILPGALVYHVFPPLVAVYVLHVTLFYAATVSLYLILKKTVGGRAAVLGALLMGCHSYFLRSMGWDYVDGAAMTYMVMTLCALTYAAKSATPRWLLMAVGVLSALTLYAQLFLIVFSPLALGYYLFARRQFGRTPGAGGWKPVGWGFAGVTVILGGFNMAVNGRFFFFANSMGMAAKLVVNHNPYNKSISHWLGGASWLILPLVALSGAIFCLWRRGEASGKTTALPLFWQRYLVVSIAILVVWEFVGQPVLQLSFYASYLIPASFLALASQMDAVLRKLKGRQFVLLSTCAVFLSLLPFWIPMQSQLMGELERFPLLLPTLAGIVAVAVIMTPIRRVHVLGVLLLSVGMGILTATTGTRTWGRPGGADDPALEQEAFLSVVDSVHAVEELDPMGNVYFWYDGEGRLGRLYRSVASTYGWAYRLQSESFPNAGSKAPPLERRILILSENPKTTLMQAEESLRSLRLGTRVIAQRKIHEGPFLWTMTEIEVSSQMDRAGAATEETQI